MIPWRDILLLAAGGGLLTLYGWWCFFRTDEAAKTFTQVLITRSPLMDSIQWGVTKLHGVIGLLAGPAMVAGAFRLLARALLR